MNRFVYILQYGSEIKAVSGNLKAIYEQLRVEMGILGELNIVSYSMVTLYMKKQNYWFFYTSSAVPFKLSKHVMKKEFNFDKLYVRKD